MEDYDVLTSSEDAVSEQIHSLVASGAQTATISGGEPTLLRKRLLATVADIRKQGVPFVELQTNAVLIDGEYAQALADAGVTSAFVSLLSHIPEHHDALCGLDGAFPKCVAGVDALLAAGIAVTLNPVTAAQTQDRVADYVDYVAQRLPGVRHLSMSAVQPHGRAAQNLELMPDYEVLRQELPRALARAQAHGLTLLNPYCGLPLCVGWVDQMSHSVEAQEAIAGQWSGPQGVDNAGNKRHGAPCQRCALRTRCGGAWHAYWSVRGGSGLSAPELLGSPWRGDWVDTPNQSRVVVTDVGAAVEALRGIRTATRWVISGAIEPGEMTRLCKAGATDWVWRTSGEVDGHKNMLVGMRRILEEQRGRPAQGRCRFLWWVEGPLTPKQAHRWAGLAHAMGVERVLLDGANLDPVFWEAAASRYTETSVERVDAD